MKKASLYAMALLYIITGSFHFIRPAFYTVIIPPWIPFPLLITYISGVAEILGGLFLLPLKTRRMAALGIILLLIAVFPANIQMTVNYYRNHEPLAWITLLRLPLQIVLIVWAWQFAKKKPVTAGME